jgi:hypothetical protein
MSMSYYRSSPHTAGVARFQAMLLGRMKPEELPAMHVVLHLDRGWQNDGERCTIIYIYR